MVFDKAYSLEKLIFVGLNGWAVALHRDTGEIVWSNDQMKSGYTTMLLDGDRLIVSTNGYIFCLDPMTGEILWNNPMEGYGMGTAASLVSVRGQSASNEVTLTQLYAEGAATSGASAAAAAGS